jgi:hypothetical protein
MVRALALAGKLHMVGSVVDLVQMMAKEGQAATMVYFTHHHRHQILM